jgi:hypothetical protein
MRARFFPELGTAAAGARRTVGGRVTPPGGKMVMSEAVWKDVSGNISAEAGPLRAILPTR